MRELVEIAPVLDWLILSQLKGCAMGLFKATREAFTKGVEGSDSYIRADNPVICSHCGGQSFEKSSALLNSRGLTFLDLDWANAEADIFVCKKCGHIEWFADI